MRDPYSYGFPGDVSFTPQNRIKELYFGPTEEKNMRSVPSGMHMAPVGKTVLNGRRGGLAGRRGVGALFAVPMREVTGRPVMRAAYEMGRLGCPTPIGMAALGDAVADRAACMATTGAMVGGSGIAQSMHEGSGGGDQGWSAGINVFTALATTAQAMCVLIQTGSQVQSAPPGPTPPPLPPATSSMPSGYSSAPAGGNFMDGVPPWAIFAGAAVVGGLVVVVAGRK